MNKSLYTIIGFLFVSCFFITSCGTDDTQTVATFTNLVAEDNFDEDGQINTSFWNFDIGDGSEQGIPGWGNNELQFYTDRPENVTVQNGFY